MAGDAFADGRGPGAPAGSQESPEEAQGQGKRRWPEPTAQDVCQGEPGAATAQSLVYTDGFVDSPNTPRITRHDLRDGFPKTSQLSKKPAIRFARSPVRGRQHFFYPRLFVLELLELRWQKYSDGYNI